MPQRVDLETKWRTSLTSVFATVYGQHPKLGRELLIVQVAAEGRTQRRCRRAMAAGRRGGADSSTLCLFGTATHVVVQRSLRGVPRFKGGRLGTTTARHRRAQRKEKQMFGTFKKAMVAVAAVAAIGTVAPAVASADVWQADNPVVSPYTGAAQVEGRLTLTLAANGATTACDVAGTLDLTNPGGVAHGQVTSFILGTAVTGNACTTSLPGCSVTATANTTTPWTVSTSGTNVTISGISFTNTYSGAGCAQNGLALTATGSITGVATSGSNVITFTNAAGLTTPLGPATVSGSVAATVDGAPSRQITLVP